MQLLLLPLVAHRGTVCRPPWWQAVLLRLDCGHYTVYDSTVVSESESTQQTTLASYASYSDSERRHKTEPV